MPFVPPLFKDIGKSLKDHLTKKYDDEKDRGQLFTGRVVKFKTDNGDGVTIDTYTRSQNGAFLCEANTTVKHKKGKATLKLATNKTVELGCVVNGLYDGLKSEFSLKHAAYGKAKDAVNHGVIDLQLKKDFISSQLKLTPVFPTSTLDAEVSAVIGEEGLSVGAKYPMSFKDMKPVAVENPLDNLSLAVEMNLKNLTCTMLTKPKGEVELGFMQSVNGSTTVGGKFHVKKESVPRAPSLLSLALSHKLDSNTTFNGVFCSNGSIKSTLERNLVDPNMTIALTYGIDLTKGSGNVSGPGIAVRVGDA